MGKHSHGYRAVHVVPEVLGHPVEVQVRTIYQDLWAQVMEALGDMWGRAVRYGGEPEDPEVPAFGEPSLSRGSLVARWIESSGWLRHIEELENTLGRMKRDPSTPPDDIAALERHIEQSFRPFLDSTREMAEMLSERRGQ